MPTPNLSTVRLQILQAMEASFTALTADQPTDDPYGVAFSTVALGPLMDWDQRKRYSLGIVAGPEKVTYLYPYVECLWTVNVEFRVTVNRDDPDPGVLIEQLMGVVERRLTEDRSWGGLAIDTKIMNTEVDLVTYADRTAVGVCVISIQYRRDMNDPRSSQPRY
jgi:hypothetical protein